MSYAQGAFVMMQLGSFQFGLSTAAYQELERTTEYRWPSHETYGTLPTSQSTGPGDDTINVQGVILPEFRGGFGQLDALRDLAGTMQPLLLVSGDGRIMGRWCITKVQEKQAIFAAYGRPRRQEFTLNLKRFDE